MDDLTRTARSGLRRVLWFVVGPIVVVGLAGAQDLPEHVLLLRALKHHIGKQVEQLPNCTCLATFQRFHREAAPRAKLQFLDTVRLEVVYSNGHEWYASPGDIHRSEQDPVAFIGAGMIANGTFATTLHNLFVTDAATFTYEGESTTDRPTIKYGFRLQTLGSYAVRISIPEGSGTVGEKGSFVADTKTLDLLRLEVQVTDIPVFLPLASADFTVTYAQTRAGELDAVLPQQADLHMVLGSSAEDYDRIDFTHCRTFESHSAIRFDSADSVDAPSDPIHSKAQPRGSSIPPLLLVAIRTTEPITSQCFVGQVIEGRVSGEVRRKGKVVIEDGARVRGRIRRLDRVLSGRFAVGLEFTEVEAQGVPMRFYGDLIRMANRKGIQPILRDSVELPDHSVILNEVSIPELPGVASFFVAGDSFNLPAGFETIWRTRSLLRGY